MHNKKRDYVLQHNPFFIKTRKKIRELKYNNFTYNIAHYFKKIKSVLSKYTL